jgi:hypothetical protein
MRSNFSFWPKLAAFTALIAIAMTSIAQARAAAPALVLKTDSAHFTIDGQGSLSEVTRRSGGRNYLATGEPSPLLSLRLAGKYHAPDRAHWNAAANLLILTYDDAAAKVSVKSYSKPGYVAFEITEIQCPSRIELALWGPYPTVIGEVIGETVGVVRDREFALGLQALNARTLGGYPTRENDIEDDFNADDHGHYPNLNPELRKDQSFRGDTARPTAKGSVLQAFCRNRDTARIISNWGFEQYAVPAFKDEGLVGSKIALFACPESQALKTIGQIELAEGLPHPTIDGEWAKTAPGAAAAYLIVDFSENNIGTAIEMTRQAGLKYLYHSSPFETWGHFQFKKDSFPNGLAGFKNCVNQARAAGIRVGFHTLSNFITPNDAYVTPSPDPRLAQVGASELEAAISLDDKEIRIASPACFAKKTAMNTARIGDELIRYESVSPSAPWKLLGCQRGAWGTRPATHALGATVAKLMDHDYQVFLTDASLGQEIARNVADLFNQTGAWQLSFDGLEGNWSTGYGQYGRTLFVKAWYDALNPELRGQIINDASNPGHFNWHMQTRMNWGEPWYAGFRESQTLYRFKNQVYFERNYMPHMLGWFALRPETSLEDAEWLLARAAGFDAGFALATSMSSTAQKTSDASAVNATKALSMTETILNAVRQWETARMARAFPASLKAALSDNTREFHLEAAGQNRWNLQEVHAAKFMRAANATEEIVFVNADNAQPLRWTIRSEAKEPWRDFTMEIDGKPAVANIGASVPPGGSLKYTGGTEAVISDAAWKELARVAVEPGANQIAPGLHRIKISHPTAARMKLEFSTLSQTTTLKAHP